MALPFFYLPDLSGDIVVMDEDTSKHVVQVLRMKKGEEVMLTNGKGIKAKSLITDDNRKRCAVQVLFTENEEPASNVTVAISLLKNAVRFEWFLEKAAEVGVHEIIPLLCERTEKEKFRHDRMNAILISAMLQSQQSWLPNLHLPTPIEKVIKEAKAVNKYIAHCLETKKSSLNDQPINTSTSHLILIGPEGDFTEKEIGMALQHGFQPVSLGSTRLRTETAGIAASVLLCNK